MNWTHAELAYLVNLTGIDCVRLKGTSEAKLRKTAQKVHAKLKIMQQESVHQMKALLNRNARVSKP